jgi:hypothetical protein
MHRALQSGLDPALDFTRTVGDAANGQMLLMPAQSTEFAGVKIAPIAPGNAGIGKERIQGMHLLMDAMRRENTYGAEIQGNRASVIAAGTRYRQGPSPQPRPVGVGLPWSPPRRCSRCPARRQPMAGSPASQPSWRVPPAGSSSDRPRPLRPCPRPWPGSEEVLGRER